MCAINGFLNWKGILSTDIDKVKLSLSEMEYRGPDASAIHNDKNIILGHNRLSIIDINERANQPMKSHDGNLIIVFNGEIYNFKELKSDLISKGINFKTTSDTEVLLEGYQLYGEEILQKIRGMFAFAIWDANKQELFAARDRFGEKPFYYFNTNEKFGFASNLAGIVALYEGELKINKQAIFELLSYQNIDAKTCIYKGISKLLPGHFLKISKSNCETKLYWTPNYKEKKSFSPAEIETKVHELLQHSVEEQLIADVPVGIFLSGGTDSSVIASIASKINKDVVAYTLTMPGNKQYDEEKESKYVTEKLNIKHKLIELKDDCVDNLPQILKTIEPIADASIIASMEIAKSAKNDFKVMLSGDGGDDIFGGYRAPIRYNQNPFSGNFLTKKTIDLIIKNSYYYPFNKWIHKVNDSRIFKWAGIETFYDYQQLYTELVRKIIHKTKPKNRLSEYLSDADDCCNDGEDKLLYVGLKTNLASDYLFKMDAANMLYSVESRAPFLDHRLLDFTSQLTVNQLMPNGIDKEILKKIGANYLSKEFFELPKKGFSIPYVKYMENHWGVMLQQFINEGISSDLGLIDADEVQKIITTFNQNKSNKLGKIMYGLFVFEIWLRVFHLKWNPEKIKLS